MNLFKYDAGMRQFYLAQTVYVAQPNDVAVVCYKGAHYIAVSSGHVPNTMHTGSIEVYRYVRRISFGKVRSAILTYLQRLFWQKFSTFSMSKC